MGQIHLQKYDFNDIIEDPQKKLVLIIYDIVDNKRRLKMVKLLEAYGNRVQKSAFEALLLKKQYNTLIQQIQRIIKNEDSVRIYRLNSSNEVIISGTGTTTFEENVIII